MKSWFFFPKAFDFHVVGFRSKGSFPCPYPKPTNSERLYPFSKEIPTSNDPKNTIGRDTPALLVMAEQRIW